MKESRWNTEAPHIETLIYSKAHDMYATSKDINYLWQLIKPREKMAPKAIHTSQAPQQSTGVRGSVKTDQQKLREMLAYLLKKEPEIAFWNNLNHWRSDFTFKQGAAIKRSYDERAKKDPNFDPRDESLFKSTITDEERNDPNWTPWGN